MGTKALTPTQAGRRFAKIRKSAGFKNTHALAKVSGISHASIANFESGRRPSMDIQDLLKYCEATGRPITEFYPEIEKYLPSDEYLRKQELLRQLAELEGVTK